jgi:L-lactate dehydrogenase complex protein LldF
MSGAPENRDLRHDFRRAARAALEDAALRAAVHKTTDTLVDRRAAAVAERPDFEALRAWGRERKLAVSADLEAHARRFAARVEAAGGNVYFARDGAEVGRIASRIVAERGISLAVKAKSMTAEEAGLNEDLAAAGVAVTETDLGEFIIQLAGEKPSHILAPAIHRSRAEVGELFASTLGVSADLDVPELVSCARQYLRERFLKAELGITGGNFAVAETGSLVLVTNEGNGRMATTLPPVHLAVVGIDKVLPKLADLPGFLALLTRSASGQGISSYVSLTTGPRRPGETEGPEELHVILLDNGRSRIAAGPCREILHCLHCGSCLNHCPVYRAVGGHAWESAYPGPMGSVLSPLLWGFDAYPQLPDACTLCGRCAEVCPVKIPLPEYHRELRRLRSEAGGGGHLVSRVTAALASRPFSYGGGVKAVRGVLRSGLAARVPEPESGLVHCWTSCRELPRPEPGPSFRSWWRDQGEPLFTSPLRIGQPAPEKPPPAAPAGVTLSVLDTYLERARAAGTEVERVPAGTWGEKLAILLKSEAGHPVAVPVAGWPVGLREELLEALAGLGCGVVEPGAAGDREALASARVGITFCETCVAETGSLCFPAGPGRGTLASLLPEVHLCLSVADCVVGTLEELLVEEGAALPSRLTLVTGPSRTGDIEGTMTAGVHGPGRVVHWILEG